MFKKRNKKNLYQSSAQSSYDSYLNYVKLSLFGYHGKKKDVLWVEKVTNPKGVIYVHFSGSPAWMNTYTSNIDMVHDRIMNCYQNAYREVKFFDTVSEYNPFV